MCGELLLIAYAGLFGFIWANLASLLMYSFERYALLFELRVFLISLIAGAKYKRIKEELLGVDDFQGIEEGRDYQNAVLERWSMESKLVMLLYCDTCFSVNTCLWASIGFGLFYYGLNIAYVSAFVLCAVAFTYFFIKRL